MASICSTWYEYDQPGIILYNYLRGLSVETCLLEMHALMGQSVIPDRDFIELLYEAFQKGDYRIRDRDGIIICINKVRDIHSLLYIDARLDFTIAMYLNIVRNEEEFYEIIVVLKMRTLGEVIVPVVGQLLVFPERQSWSTRMMNRLNESGNIIVADAFWIYHPDIQWQDNLSSLERYHLMPKTLVVVFCSRDLKFKLLVRIFSLNRKNTFRWYLRQPLREVLMMIKAKCPGVPLLYHYDAIMGQMHKIRVVELANYYGVEIIQPPPCAPDLALSYHGLYAKLENLVEPPVIEFDNMRDITRTEIVEDWDEIPDKVWNFWFRKWLLFVEKCADGDGRFM